MPISWSPPARSGRREAEAAAGAELVINATNGAGSVTALEAAGEDLLADKVLIDVSNPLDFSAGMPPSLLVSNTDSLGEQIQRRFPRTRVVKALNTMNAYLMVDPGQLDHGQHSAFVSGNDPQAKRAVIDLLTTLGHADTIDLGDITPRVHPCRRRPQSLYVRLG